MRRVLTWCTVLATAATGLGLYAPSTASGSCVGPMLEVRDPASNALRTATAAPGVPAVAPGEPVALFGQYFANGCDDTSGGPGCGGPEQRERVTAQRAVRLDLFQGTRTWDLGTKDADARYEIRWTTTLPKDLQPGEAVFRAGTATLTVTVTTGYSVLG